MTGAVLFVDVPAAGADPAALARILAIDLYRAKMLCAANAPFLAQGFAELAPATRAAADLTAARFASSAHEASALDALGPSEEASSFATDATGVVFSFPGGRTLALSPRSIRALVVGRLTWKIQTTTAGPKARLPRGVGGLAVAALDLASGGSGTTSERTSPGARLEIFSDAALLRVAVRHDGFDFSALAAKKTLSAVKNIEVLAQELSRAANGAPLDEAFHRTETARSGFAPDVIQEIDMTSGKQRASSAVSNRAAFDIYAKLRFLHERSKRVPGSTNDAPGGHFLEL